VIQRCLQIERLFLANDQAAEEARCDPSFVVWECSQSIPLSFSLHFKLQQEYGPISPT
jgi:hypothetical protein